MRSIYNSNTIVSTVKPCYTDNPETLATFDAENCFQSYGHFFLIKKRKLKHVEKYAQITRNLHKP